MNPQATPDPMTTEPRRLPRHVAVIMDGNGRWAQRRDLPRIEGHREGAESVRDVVRAARQIGLEALTLYAFSSQNWARPVDEVAALMDLLRDYLVSERTEILENDIRLRAIGDIDRLPPHVLEPLNALMNDSKGNRSMALTLALSYGGRESIAAGARRAAALIASGEMKASDLDADAFGALLPTSELPPLDFVVRTSGEHRISNFLLWEAAYAELHFTDVPWPEFRRQHLYEALQDYSRRERRFGRTGGQLTSATVDVAALGDRREG
jgi:undecaprenyl diphosphate synthase